MTNKEAIEILNELHDQCCQADSIFCTDVTGARCDAVDMAIEALSSSEIPNSSDTIYRQAAIDALDCINGVEEVLRALPSAQPEQRWIPCSELLPEEDVEVLITYRYKEGEGDTSHADIDITTYGQMYFGGNKVGNHKHWRQPFEYFESNYEVVAWMPLPQAYKAESEDKE